MSGKKFKIVDNSSQIKISFGNIPSFMNLSKRNSFYVIYFAKFFSEISISCI